MAEELAAHELSLRILILSRSPTRARVLEDGLRDAGYKNLALTAETQNLMRRVVAYDPHVLLIDLETPSSGDLEEMFAIARGARRPIAIFTDRSDAAWIEDAADAGIGAFVIDGLQTARFRDVIETAMGQFKAVQRLRDELERTKVALHERKLIERAKGILMAQRRLTEEAAYQLLRRAAMNDGRRIAEIAEHVIAMRRPPK